MSERSPKDMLDKILARNSPRTRAELASMLNRLFHIFHVGEMQAPGCFLASELEWAGETCTIILVDPPPFSSPVALDKPRLYASGVATTRALARSAPKSVHDFMASPSIILAINETSFVQLTDCKDYLAVTYPWSRDPNWIAIVSIDRPWWLSIAGWRWTFTDWTNLRRTVPGRIDTTPRAWRRLFRGPGKP